MQVDSSMPQVDLFESLLKTAPLSAPVRAHVSRVYQTLLVTLATAALGALLQIRYSIGGWFTAIATLATSFWLIMTPFRRGDQQNENLRTGIVCLTAFLVGCSLGPGLKATYDTLGDIVILEAFVATAAMFACFSAAAMFAPTRLSIYAAGMLSATLLVTSILGLVSFFTGYGAISGVHLFLGLVTFSLYTVFDTQLMIRRAELGYTDVPMHTLQLFLDFVNLFVRILKLLSDKKKKD